VSNCDFQKKIGYMFNDEELLRKALTHSSYTKEKKSHAGDNNERLEFLGDAFFNAIIGEELFRRANRLEEGQLTKFRARLVCEKSLAYHGRQIEIGKHIRLGKGEEFIGGRNRDSMIADTLEAVIGAVFLDGGYEAARSVVLRIFESRVGDVIGGKLDSDYKTELQEMLQAKGEMKISYLVEREEGPDHDKTFFVNLFCNGVLTGKGRGKSKKEAEQNAAKEALERGEGG